MSPFVRLLFGVAILVAARGAGAASLVLSSGLLQLETPDGSGATATISQSNGTITISSTETIALDANTISAGWTGSGTSVVSGPASAMTAGFLELGFAFVNFQSDFDALGGALILNSPAAIATDVHLTSPSGIYLGGLESASDGVNDFTAEVTDIGNIYITGNVGDISRPHSLSFSVVGPSNFIEPSATMKTTGPQTYLGAVLLQTATTLYGDGVALGNVGPANGSTLIVQGNTTISGAVGSLAGSLATFEVVNGTTTFDAGGSVMTSGPQDYTGNVTLNADTTLSVPPGNGGVHFFAAVDGAHALTITGDLFTGYSIGGTTPLSSLTVDGMTTVTNALNAISIVTTNQTQLMGPVSLSADLSLGGGLVSHGPVDGAYALTINALGNYFLGAAIGGITPPTTIAVHGATQLGAPVSAATSVRFYDPVTLVNGVTVTGPAIEFDGTLDGNDPFTAVGDTTFGGLVGATTPLGAISVTGTTHLGAASVSNVGAQTWNGPIVVSSPSTSLSTGSFAIELGGAIDRDNGAPFSLTTTTHTGVDFTGGNCDFVLAGTTAGTEYTQIASDSAVTLGCALHATSTAAGPFAAGTQFVVISGAPVSGTFTGLPQDAHTTINGQDFTVDYMHGGVRLVAGAGADMGMASPPDLAAADDLATGAGDLGGDLAAATPPDLATGTGTGTGSHSGCDYALGGAASSGAVAIVAFLLLLALVRRAARKLSAP